MSGVFKSLVSNVNGGSGHTTITSPSITCAPGDTLIIVVFVGSSIDFPVNAMTDTFSVHNTYQVATGSHVFNGTLFGGTNVQIWYATNVSGGTGTITAVWSTNNSGFSQIYVGNWGNVAKTGALAAANSATGTSANPSLTVGGGKANDLVIGCLGDANALTWVNMTDRTGGVSASYASATASSASAFTAQSTATSALYIGTIARFNTTGAAPVSSSSGTISTRRKKMIRTWLPGPGQNPDV